MGRSRCHDGLGLQLAGRAQVSGIRAESASNPSRVSAARRHPDGVQEIARRVGFDDGLVFSLSFRRIQGVSPSESRQRYQSVATWTKRAGPVMREDGGRPA
jgi:AraC-like DNA-binding protein